MRVFPETAKLKTENARLRTALEQCEKRFSELFYRFPNPVTITTREGRIVDLNEAAASLVGCRQDELIGRIRAEAEPFADSEQKKQALRQLTDTAGSHDSKIRIRKNGDTRTVLHSSEPIVFEDQPCFLCVSIDITELEKETETLKESDEKYRALIENSLQALAIIQDSRIVFCNRKFAESLGYSVDELLSLSPQGVKALIHFEDQALLWNRQYNRLAGEAVPSHYEHRAITKDGNEIWVEAYACLIEYKGRTAIQIAYIDITERKSTELKLRESKEYLDLIINHIGDGIFVKDPNHKHVHVNDLFCIANGRRREELLGKSVLDILPKAQAEAIWEREQRVLETGEEMLIEEEIRDDHGRIRTVMTKMGLLANGNGNKQIVGTIRDITEHKRLQAQFAQSQKMEAIGVLAGGIAHDFNNLLSVIKGYAELLSEDLAPDDPRRPDLAQILRAGQHGESLISQLLAFSRKQILQPKILNLNQVVTDLCTMLRRMIGEDIKLETKAQSELGMIHADPVSIQQIIMNLAVNARDAMPQGGKLTIEIANANLDDAYFHSHHGVKPGAYVMMAVSDNGVGMDAETQSRIFEPFFTTKAQGKGTGLGLSTVYGIVKQSNGFIWVYSEPGKGTTFKIYFPSAEGKNAKLEDDVALESPFMGSETVLVVEDEFPVRTLASRILHRRGYNVIQASDGDEALRKAQAHTGQIDLLLTDVVMPGMSGTELVAQMETLRPGIKSLYISGYANDAIVDHGILAPDVNFLQKPFTVESLMRKVHEAIHS
jgi:two-component system, cell cycle sensor histidine kinase and response regulator CckA